MASQIITLDIKSDVDRMARNLTSFQKKEVPKAVNATVNKVAVTVRKEGIREISSVSGIKASTLRRAIDIKRANFQTLVAIIKAVGQHINIAKFSGRQTKKGVSAAPWKKRQVFPGTFIVQKLGRNAFKRTGRFKIDPETGKKKEIIASVHGPNLAREFGRETMTRIFNSIGRSRFREVFPRELRFRLERARRK